MFLHMQPTEPDDVLRSFGINVSRVCQNPQQAGSSDYLSLGFRDFVAVALETRRFSGV
jgi:hypothetical protein